MANSEIGNWEKIDIILKPVGGLLTAITVAGIGWYGTHTLNHLQEAETKSRTYAQLVTQREEADSALRKDMFSSIVNTFLNPSSEEHVELSSSEQIGQRILNLEMLAYNFHDALDLAPLFKDVRTQIDGSDRAVTRLGQTERDSYIDRLEKIAKEIGGKELAALATPTTIATGSIDFECHNWTLDPNGEAPQYCEQAFVDSGTIIQTVLALESPSPQQQPVPARKFEVQALNVDEQKKELRVRLRVSESADVYELEPEEMEGAKKEFDGTFWVDSFDFPMIDNTRLTNNERCAVVLTHFESDSAEVSLVYFPASRASLKDKPFYEEVISDLLGRGGTE